MPSSTADEWWDELRKPFPDDVIGKLPRISCFDCSQAAKKAQRTRDKHCDRHSVTECKVCGNYITTAHIHLDYVGHATTTDRLLKVDPEWTWRPMATEVDTGFPKFDSQGGLWILLTIKGVTRPGYGDGKTSKEVIGDAIRNAAMRFGVALDLWAKEDLQASRSEETTGGGPPPARAPKPASTGSARPTGKNDPETERAAAQRSTITLREGDAAKVVTLAQRKKMWVTAQGYGISEEELRRIVKRVAGVDSTKQIPRHMMDTILKEIELEGLGTPK